MTQESSDLFFTENKQQQEVKLNMILLPLQPSNSKKIVNMLLAKTQSGDLLCNLNSQIWNKFDLFKKSMTQTNKQTNKKQTNTSQANKQSKTQTNKQSKKQTNKIHEYIDKY